MMRVDGHKITWVVNGLKAVEIFPSKTFDIVLMDFQMPIMNDDFKCKNIEAAQHHLTILTHTFTRSLALINGLVQPTNSRQLYPVMSKLEAIEQIKILRELFKNFQLFDLILKKINSAIASFKQS
ncbi:MULTISPECIES: hypothetical protein [unclassified Colwellia]|uniref:hypothetical protein n=1 Tax=unclassified Colwellia TaxID=196834 RepID=UPI0015F64175|nr:MULTISPECIES: hypothetical protein [unclassified Colwellia]MBA6364407.1 hypothetical protein [Colwellia sp. BRX8-8]MBA6372035.1 hypothetical protein [Colwellia sp. BRX8-4]MBA6379173.1 hypothetical protein [Colwellia sp. BRX10-7]MBA6386081.1 hypothetical protein [Colwellia sp. BRX10-2]MBA6401946.1 hypothetical protein [Colwellia sp. BRX10-5]